MQELGRADVNRMQRRARTDLDVIDDFGAFFSLPFLRAHNLFAAIFEGDFRDKDEIVSRACQAADLHDLVCFSIDPAVEEGFRLAASHEDLRSVRTQFHTPSYVIADIRERVTIVSDSDYYWGVAGPADLVTRVTGGSIVEHLAAFDRSTAPFVLSHDAHNARIGAMLSRFAETCKARCADAT